MAENAGRFRRLIQAIIAFLRLKRNSAARKRVREASFIEVRQRYHPHFVHVTRVILVRRRWMMRTPFVKRRQVLVRTDIDIPVPIDKTNADCVLQTATNSKRLRVDNHLTEQIIAGDEVLHCRYSLFETKNHPACG